MSRNDRLSSADEGCGDADESQEVFGCLALRS
jgi:hypothetical protein